LSRCQGRNPRISNGNLKRETLDRRNLARRARSRMFASQRTAEVTEKITDAILVRNTQSAGLQSDKSKKTLL
jgi:hypothetical protein